MKTLKESILSDMDTTLQHGDDWEKNIKNETKEFLKAIGTVKNYEGGYSLKNGHAIRIFTPNTLQELGYDANHIQIFMYTMDSFSYSNGNDDWALEIELTKRSDDNIKYIRTGVWHKKVYMDRWEFSKWNNIVKDLIKPATKSLDTFKRFLNNMEKWNNQFTDHKLLLK